MRLPRPSGALTRDAVAQPIWARPDPALIAAGIEGEYVVARVRLVAMGLLLIAPTYNVLTAPEKSVHVAGFLVTLAAAIASLGIWRALRVGEWRPWVGFASSSFDVSMVTLALVSFLMVATPMVALNSTVTFEMYFLALVATSLRYDGRICIVVGVLAVLQYGALWAYAASAYDLADPSYVSEAGPYNPVDIFTRLLLLAIATLLALTLVRRAQRLLYLAAHDRLTGLYNRGHFDGALSTAFLQATRDQAKLSVAILDVDHFKRINDEHGHAVGDRVLQVLAERLGAAMRRTDVVARYGGEEFVLLMPSTGVADALGHVEEVRQSVHGAPIPLGQGRTLAINFSAGVAGLPVDAEAKTAGELLTLADHRLLEAKRQGRGRCIGQFLPT